MERKLFNCTFIVEEDQMLETIEKSQQDLVIMIHIKKSKLNLWLTAPKGASTVN